MKVVIGTTGNIAGGTRGALQTDFPQLGDAASSATRRRRRMVFEGDFVAGEHQRGDQGQARHRLTTCSRSRRSTAPRRRWSAAATSPCMFKDTPAGQAFMTYLATPEAAEIWAEHGGFPSPNKNLDPSVYPGRHHPHDRRRAGRGGDLPLRHVRPAAGGLRRARTGQGEWKIFRTS